MEAPRYDDDDLNLLPLPTREYAREEKTIQDRRTAERINEIVFFSNIAMFSIFTVIGCTIFITFLPSFLSVVFSIVSSFIMLIGLKKTIRKIAKCKCNLATR